MKRYPYAPLSLSNQESLPVEEEEPIEEDPKQESKNKRRSKTDQDGRSYKCGCGKMYLSYPALYTHIKTKHEGINPEGTNAPQFKNGRGRGRPRKLKDTTDPIKEQKLHPSDNIRKNPNFADEIQFLREICEYSQDGTDPLQDFPSILIRNEISEHPIKTVIKEQDFSQETVQGVLAKFLFEHAKVCTKEFYSSTSLMACLLYKYLNEEIEGDYCSRLECEDLPVHIGGFSTYIKDLEFDIEKDKLNLFVKHLCEWLYAHGLTHKKIEIAY